MANILDERKINVLKKKKKEKKMEISPIWREQSWQADLWEKTRYWKSRAFKDAYISRGKSRLDVRSVSLQESFPFDFLLQAFLSHETCSFFNFLPFFSLNDLSKYLTWVLFFNSNIKWLMRYKDEINIQKIKDKFF
jgi:hypothetical protein